MVIGYPLEHSQSPLLHYTVYKRFGINSVLLAQPHLQLRSLIQAIKVLNVELTAVTAPYKEKVLKYIDRCSREVKVLQSANTLIQREGKLYGYNTDVDGIAFALRNITLQNKRILIIGAGGAARAMCYFLKNNKATIFLLNRTKHKATKLAKEFGARVISHIKVNTLDIDIIINTTPIGLYPHINKSPLPNYIFHANQIVFDIIYHPVNTQLLKQAKKCRAKTISGLDMFIGQGLKQIELLTGKALRTVSMIDMLKKILIKNQRAIPT